MKSYITWLLILVATLLTSQVSLADESTEAVVQEPQKTERVLAEEWVVSFMTKHAPPGRKTYYADAQETKEDALARYASIAKDLIEVVYDPDNKPLFGGSNGRARTVSVMLAVALYESGFGKHVDFGIGKFGRGDAGKSWCLLQINIGSGRVWPGGWNLKESRPWKPGDDLKDRVQGASGPEMVQDRRLCFKEALRSMRMSFSACAGRPVKERLNAYASGSCAKGSKESRLRLTAAMKFWDDSKEARSKFKDENVKAQVVTDLSKREAATPVAQDSKKDPELKPATPQKAEKPTEVAPQAQRESVEVAPGS